MNDHRFPYRKWPSIRGHGHILLFPKTFADLPASTRKSGFTKLHDNESGFRILLPVKRNHEWEKNTLSFFTTKDT